MKKYASTCRKVCYASKKAAKAAMKQINRTQKFSLDHVYFCDICSHWHVTSMDRDRAKEWSRKKENAKSVNGSATLNCVICHVPASGHSGHVHKNGEYVVAGLCKAHFKDRKTLQVQADHIGCYGEWKPEMGYDPTWMQVGYIDKDGFKPMTLNVKGMNEQRIAVTEAGREKTAKIGKSWEGIPSNELLYMQELVKHKSITLVEYKKKFVGWQNPTVDTFVEKMIVKGQIKYV